MTAQEMNFDGLVGPTHNYSGLAWGNIASNLHAGKVSNPQKAALQGIEKMRFMMGLGMAQGFFPPHLRPDFATLRMLGFAGNDEQIIESCFRKNPALLAQVYSSSFMWAANAATVTPSSDSADGKVHFTPANLLTHFHRSVEHTNTARTLRTIFADINYFVHHETLPAHYQFADEGAANHTRFGKYGAQGIGFFVYGREADGHEHLQKFPARQAKLASELIARAHGVKAVYAQQYPGAIDAGVFHNDVIAVGNEHVLLCHEHAFTDQEATFAALRALQPDICVVQVAAKDMPLEDAVKSYFFNSQLVTLSNGEMAVIAPREAEENSSARAMFERIKQADDNPIAHIHYVDVRESMQNGGGPACLRLRVVLTDAEMQAVHSGAIATEQKLILLENWVKKYYRDRLAPSDLADPLFAVEARAADAELRSQIMNIHIKEDGASDRN